MGVPAWVAAGTGRSEQTPTHVKPHGASILALMHRKLLAVDGLYGDVPYAYAAVAPPGGMVFTAGACPLDPDGRIVAPGDIEAQARHAIGNLLAVLEAVGCGPNEVIKTTVFVASTESADLATAWREVEQVFGSDGPPSTLLGVTGLGWPDQLFEIEAVAARPPS
jgi:enamine deaminase RidA (YjgF/YER057c/UK114 family)